MNEEVHRQDERLESMTISPKFKYTVHSARDVNKFTISVEYTGRGGMQRISNPPPLTPQAQKHTFLSKECNLYLSSISKYLLGLISVPIPFFFSKRLDIALAFHFFNVHSAVNVASVTTISESIIRTVTTDLTHFY